MEGAALAMGFPGGWLGALYNFSRPEWRPAMLPCDGPAICPPEGAPPPTLLEKALRAGAVVTMLMTVPQVWSIWTTSGPTDVSLLSWVTYLISSAAWLAYGIQKRDATICFANIGWVAMDGGIIAGIVIRHGAA
jgi:uncharacterized protein with PQ loop repeat